MLGGPGAEEVDVEDADLIAFLLHVLDRFVTYIGARAHDDDDAISIGRAKVIEQVILAAGDLREEIHRGLHLLGAGIIELVACFAGLKEHVGVLGGAAENRAVGREGAAAVSLDHVVGHHRAKVIVIEHLDLGDFMAGAETVEEVHERDAAGEGGAVGHGGEVVSGLHTLGTEHCEARLPAGHHVGMVAENREGMRRQRACGHVHDERGEFAGDLVHVGDHQQQTLGGREGRAEGARLQGAVDGAGSAAFGLHFRHRRDGSPDVLLALGGPFIRELAHRARWGNRVNGNNFGYSMGNGGYRLVGI